MSVYSCASEIKVAAIKMKEASDAMQRGYREMLRLSGDVPGANLADIEWLVNTEARVGLRRSAALAMDSFIYGKVAEQLVADLEGETLARGRYVRL